MSEEQDLRNMPDEYWRDRLTPEEYRVLREHGTEPPWSGKYVEADGDGEYHCAACGNKLFSTNTQYVSKLRGLEGWPSFGDIAADDAVELVDDDSFGMHRTEVICKKCGSHLGHVFDGDPDSATGKHYCVNSCALKFDSQGTST